MATANKSTGLQIALVFAVMAAIIALVVAFLQFRHASEVDVQLTTDKTDKAKVEGELRLAQADQQTLKELIGFPTVEVGKLQQEGDTTVVGQTRKLMAEVSAGEAATTVDAALRAAAGSLNQLRSQLDGERAGNAKLNDRIASLQGEYQKQVDRHDQARKDAEIARNEAQTSKEEAVKGKEQELNARAEKIQQLEAAVQAKDQEMAQYRGDMTKKTARLETSTKVFAPQETRSRSLRSRFPAARFNLSTPTRASSGSTVVRRTH